MMGNAQLKIILLYHGAVPKMEGLSVILTSFFSSASSSSSDSSCSSCPARLEDFSPVWFRVDAVCLEGDFSPSYSSRLAFKSIISSSGFNYLLSSCEDTSMFSNTLALFPSEGESSLASDLLFVFTSLGA